MKGGIWILLALPLVTACQNPLGSMSQADPSFMPGISGPAQLQLAGTAVIQAGSCASYRLNLLDGQSQPVAASQSTAIALGAVSVGSFYADSSCLTPLASLTLGAGEKTAQFYYRGTTLDTLSFEAQAQGLQGATLAVTLVPGAASSTRATVTGSSPVAADGSATSTVTVTLEDAYGNPIGGVTPVFAASGSGNTIGACGVSDSSGQSSCALSSTGAGMKTLSLVSPVAVTGGDVSFESTPSLTVTAPTEDTNTNTVTFGGACTPSEGITVSGSQSATLTCTSGGTWSWTSGTEGSDGSYPFSFTESVGSTSSSASGSWLRDTVAPAAVTGFLDGAISTSVAGSPLMTWNATTDNVGGSGLSHYELAVGSVAGGTDIVGWTNAGNTTFYQFTGLSLANGGMYYGSIRAVDNAGNISTVTQGDGFAVVTETPTLNLDLMGGTLPVQVRFANASGSGIAVPTFFDSSGVLQAAPENLLEYSLALTTAPWGTNGGPTVTAGQPSPDGGTGAVLVVPGTTYNPYDVTQGFSGAPGTNYTFSIYAKASGYDWLHLQIYDFSNPNGGIDGWYDLSTGTPGTAMAEGGSGATAPAISMESVGAGWYRCILAGLPTTNATPRLSVVSRVDNADGVNFMSGNGSSGILMWGAQLEAGSSASSFITTSGAPAYGPRFDYNPTTSSLQGLLLEERRTNVIPNSNTGNPGWLSASSTDIPPLYSAATVWKATTSSSQGNDGAFVNLPASSGTTYTASVWVYIPSAYSDVMPQMDLDLPGNVGTVVNSSNRFANSAIRDKWQRLWITSTPTGGGTTVNWVMRTSSSGSGQSYYYSLPQLEAGGSPTSYIPTAGTAMTRSADVATVPTTAGSWYDSSQGTLYASFLMDAYTGNMQAPVDLNDTTYNNRIGARVGTGPGSMYFPIFISGTGEGGPSAGSVALSQIQQLAVAYESGNYAATLNGVAPGTDSSIAGVPSITTLQLGSQYGGNQPLDGWLQSVQYYNARLSNAALQELTQP